MGKTKWSILGAWVVCYQQTYHFPFVLPNCVEFLFFIIPVVQICVRHSSIHIPHIFLSLAHQVGRGWEVRVYD